MSTETYKGRKIVAVRRRGRNCAVYLVRLNGVEIRRVPVYQADDVGIIDQIKREIDYVGDVPDGGWGMEWYAPATVEPCAEGLHPQPIGGPCPHPSCIERNAGPKTPCRKCGVPVTRHQPIGHREGESLWVTAHRAPGSDLLCGASDLPDQDGAFAAMADRKITVRP